MYYLGHLLWLWALIKYDMLKELTLDKEDNIIGYVFFFVQHQLFSLSYFNECSQLQKTSKIVYLYVKPLFLYYFLLIATMIKTMLVNSQQISFIILFICEVITLHKINIWCFYFYLSFLLFNSLKIIARKQSPQLKTTLYYV